MLECENLEFEILGCSVKFKSDTGASGLPDGVEARAVVALVEDEIKALKSKAPDLDDGKVAILAALKIAADKLELELEYRDNIDRLQNSATKALRYMS